MGQGIVCSKCKQEKSKIEFYADDRYSNGFTPWCKDCANDYRRKWRQTPKGKESQRRANVQYVQKNGQSEKSREYHRLYKKGRQGKIAQLRSWLKNLYNITLEEYEELDKRQNSLCAICGQVNKSGNRLGVDHCHKTGRVRGLLCFRCNTALGLLDDSSTWVFNMLNYLRET